MKITHVGGARRDIKDDPSVPGRVARRGFSIPPLETYKTLNRHISHGQFIIPFFRVSSTTATARFNPSCRPPPPLSLLSIVPRGFFTFSLDGSPFDESSPIDMQNPRWTPIFILSHASRAIEKFAWIDYRTALGYYTGQEDRIAIVARRNNARVFRN